MATGRILITGGSGFIGCNLVDYYEKAGWEVWNLSDVPPRNKKQEHLYKLCDINNADLVHQLFAEFRPDFVVHLAARTDLDGKTIEDYRTNVGGTQNVVNAVNQVGSVQRAVYASSRLVFEIGHSPAHDYDYRPSTPYGESKIETERIVKSQGDSCVPWMLIRPTSIWGEWFHVPYRTFFELVLNRRYVHPKGVSIQKSYGYVGSTCHEIEQFRCADNDRFHQKVYFATDYPPIEVLQWGNEIARQAGLPPVREVPLGLLKFVAIAGDIAKNIGVKNPPLTSFRLNNILTPMVYDTSREEEVVGALPFSMEEGVARTLEWLNEH